MSNFGSLGPGIINKIQQSGNSIIVQPFLSTINLLLFTHIMASVSDSKSLCYLFVIVAVFKIKSWLLKFLKKNHSERRLTQVLPVLPLWKYRLWIFKSRDKKLVRFQVKHKCAQSRKLKFLLKRNDSRILKNAQS